MTDRDPLYQKCAEALCRIRYSPPVWVVREDPAFRAAVDTAYEAGLVDGAALAIADQVDWPSLDDWTEAANTPPSHPDDDYLYEPTDNDHRY